jgi:hypothetical protein
MSLNGNGLGVVATPGGVTGASELGAGPTTLTLGVSNPPAIWTFNSTGQLITPFNGNSVALTNSNGQLTLAPLTGGNNTWSIQSNQYGYAISSQTTGGAVVQPQCVVNTGGTFSLGSCSSATRFAFINAGGNLGL